MATIELIARAADDGTQIEVLDPHLRPIPHEHSLREVRLQVEPGVYAVRFIRGLAVTEKVALVTADGGPVSVQLEETEEPRTTTAAPLAYSNLSDDGQSAAAERISRGHATPIGKSDSNVGQLLLFVRSDDREAGRRPDTGLSLHDFAGRLLWRSEDAAEANPEQGWAGRLVTLDAGAYRLRRIVGDEAVIEQIVHVCTGWQTQFFAQAVLREDRADLTDFARVAVLMARPGIGFDASAREAGHTEAALRALRERRSIPGAMSEAMLQGNFDNPMLGILAALLQLRRTDVEIRSLHRLVSHLVLLVGPIPDVIAIGLAMMTRDASLKNDTTLRDLMLPGLLVKPPYYNESWRHICDASATDPTLVPTDSLAAATSKSADRATAWFRWQLLPTDPAIGRSGTEPEPLLLKGSGLFSRFVNNAFQIFGITSATVERLSTATLNTVLAVLQHALSELDDPFHQLQRPVYTALDRRIAHFVYPLGDPLLNVLIDRLGERGAATRDAVLTRGRDGTELARALQLPLGTAIGEALRLQGKLLQSVSALVSDRQVARFVEQESQGNGALREAMESLRGVAVPVRLAEGGHALNALQYLSLRYRGAKGAGDAVAAGALTDVARQLADESGAPATPKHLGLALRTAQNALRKEISVRTRAGQLEFADTRPGRPIAAVSRYSRGRLFPPVRTAASTPAVESKADSGGA